MSAVVEYLDLDDYVTIAEHVTGTDRAVLAGLPRIGLAQSAPAAPAAGFGEVEASRSST